MLFEVSGCKSEIGLPDTLTQPYLVEGVNWRCPEIWIA
jgi:hypothetical protein